MAEMGGTGGFKKTSHFVPLSYVAFASRQVGKASNGHPCLYMLCRVHTFGGNKIHFEDNIIPIFCTKHLHYLFGSMLGRMARFVYFVSISTHMHHRDLSSVECIQPPFQVLCHENLVRVEGGLSGSSVRLTIVNCLPG